MRRLLPILALLIILFSNAEAHYGAKYEPPDGTTYHGVGWQSQAQIDYCAIFPDSLQPLLFQMMSPLPGYMRRNGMTVGGLLNQFRSRHIDQRQQYLELSLHFSLEGEPVDHEFADSERYDGYIDTLSIAFTEYGRPIFLRIGLEMNGDWNGYTPWVFPRAYRKLVEGLRRNQVENFATVWCYEPDAPDDFADSSRAGWKWYPGDDVVDWFGLDPFDADHFDPAEPDSAETRNGWELSKKGRTEKFLRFAEERGKPVYLNELSARHVWVTPHQEDVDSTHGEVDWNYWFAPFFEFLDNHPNIKAFNYINLDWSQIDHWAHWGDARIQVNEYIRDQWVAELSAERYIHSGYNIAQPVGVSEAESILPHQFEMAVYPNPFNSSFIINYNLAQSETVTLKLYTLSGAEVLSIFEGLQTAGDHQYFVNGLDLATGVYLLRLESEKTIQSRKVVLIR